MKTCRAAAVECSLVIVLAAASLLGACGGDPVADVDPSRDGRADAAAADLSTTDGEAGPVAGDEPAPSALVTGAPSAADPGGEAALRGLESRVATDVLDARNHESWVCTGEARRIEYRFSVGLDGTRRGAELDGRGELVSSEFGWAAIGADTLLLDYPEVGRQTELGSILFAGDDALRTNDGASGPLECRRQRYVDGAPTRDVAVQASGDVDRNVEAAATLAGRIETSRSDDGAFDYWYCEMADGPPTGYVFAGEGVLDPERRAVSFAIASAGTFDGGGAAGDDAGASGGDAPRMPRPRFDPDVDGGREWFRWLATDGATLVLVPLDADVAAADAVLATTSLDGIVFPVDDAFTARRSDGVLLQCLRDGDV